MGIVAAETNGTVMNSEAKISYAGIFAMIANFRYDSEKYCA